MMISSMKLELVICCTVMLCAFTRAFPTLPDDPDKILDDSLMASTEVDQLSLLTRYAGMGYNLLRGNPEGDFLRGGGPILRSNSHGSSLSILSSITVWLSIVDKHLKCQIR